MWAGGSDVCPSSENQYNDSTNTGRAFPSAGEITVRMESRLSAFTMTVRFIGSSAVVCSDLWGKEAILRSYERGMDSRSSGR